MSEAFLVRRGGNTISGAYALIAVSYPVGSTCTATKGAKTLTARSDNGAYCFQIPDAGTWVVAITNGTKTATKSVVINTAGQVEKLTMRYERVLFENGSGAEDWSVSPSDHASIGNVIHLDGAHGTVYGSVQVYAYLTDAIPLSGMQVVEVITSTSFVGGMSHAGHAQVRVVEAGTAYSGTAAAATDLVEGSGKTTALDVSALDASKTYRVVLYASGGVADEGGGVIVDTLDVAVDASKVRVY